MQPGPSSRPVGVAQREGVPLRYAYDPLGNVATTTLEDGAVITRTYDAANRHTRWDFSTSGWTRRPSRWTATQRWRRTATMPWGTWSAPRSNWMVARWPGTLQTPCAWALAAVKAQKSMNAATRTATVPAQ
jgi:YD repeat-containing protein